MKYFIQSLVCICFAGGLVARPLNDKDISDTIKPKELIPVKVYSLIKGANQPLVNFYIANKSATTEDILSRLPEMNMIRRGSYGMEPVLRSYSSGQTSLLIDGMRMHGACTDKMDPVSIYIEPQNLQSIQVQTTHGFHSGSVVGGSVNLKFATPTFNETSLFSGTVSSGYQSAANAVYHTGTFNYGTKRLALRTTVSYRNAQDYRSGGGVVIPFSKYQKINYGLSVKYALRNSWIAKTDILFDDGWNIGYPALPMDVGYAGARIVSLSMQNETGNNHFKQTEIKLYANSVRHYMDDSQRKNISIHMDMPGESNTYGAYIDSRLQFRNNTKINLKADITSTDLIASMTMYQSGQPPMFMLTWPDNRTMQSGIGATFIKQLDSTSGLVISTRADLFIKSLITQSAKDQLSVLNQPVSNVSRLLKNLSVQYNKTAGKKTKTTISVSYSERMPVSSELYGFYLFNANDGFDYIGNTNLVPENAINAEAGIVHKQTFFQLSLTGYATVIHQYITGVYQPTLSSMTIGANGVKSYQQIPRVFIAGVEAMIIAKPSSSLDLVSTSKFSYGKDYQNNPLPMIAPLKNTTSLRKIINKWAIQAETEWAFTQNRINPYSRETATQSYGIFNLRLMYDTPLLNNQLRVDTGIDNLLDNDYKEHLDWGRINRPGRNLYMQITLSF